MTNEKFSTDGAVCPYCDHLNNPNDDYGLHSSDIEEWECGSCGETFGVHVYTRFSWTTSSIEEEVSQ